MGVVGGMALVFVGLITATLITNRAKAVAAGSSQGGASGSSPYDPAFAAAGPLAFDGSDSDAADASESAGGSALAADGSAAAADDPGRRSGQRLPVTGFSNLGAAALGVAAVLLASGLAIIVRMRRRSG